MKRRLSRLWTFLAVASSVTLAALSRPAILRMGQHRPRFVYACVPLLPAAYDALAARAGWAKTALVVAPGVSLNGLVRHPEHEHGARWILFFPGNDESQLTAGQKFLERVAEGRDFGLLVYAYRGFDSSGGEPSPQTLRDDGYRILEDLLAREGVLPSNVHVVAFSLGGYVAASAVGRAAAGTERAGGNANANANANANGKRVASLSTLAAVASMEMARSKWHDRVSIGDLIETLPLLDDVPGPVLVLHGGADETLSVEQGRAIAARLGARARFRELPGVGHLEINTNAEAMQAVRAMIGASAPP